MINTKNDIERFELVNRGDTYGIYDHKIKKDVKYNIFNYKVTKTHDINNHYIRSRHKIIYLILAGLNQGSFND